MNPMLTPLDDLSLTLLGDGHASRLRAGVDHVRASMVPRQHRDKFRVVAEGPGGARRSVEDRAGDGGGHLADEPAMTPELRAELDAREQTLANLRRANGPDGRDGRDQLDAIVADPYSALQRLDSAVEDERLRASDPERADELLLAAAEAQMDREQRVTRVHEHFGERGYELGFGA